ncbi:hypothetical protein GGI02_005247, partial [Coemansia sp. RSA 2322]
MSVQKTKRAASGAALESPAQLVSHSSDEEQNERPTANTKRPRQEPAKSRVEVNLERLVFGGDDMDGSNDIFGKESHVHEEPSESDMSEAEIGDEEMESGNEDSADDEPLNEDSLFFVDIERDSDRPNSEPE